MELFVTIVICLLASVGVVQALGWALCRAARPPRLSRGYGVILLERDPARLEAQLRYELLCLRWCDCGRRSPLFLMDPGLEPEALAVCERMLRGVGGVWLCAPGELPCLTGMEDDLHCPGDGI